MEVGVGVSHMDRIDDRDELPSRPAVCGVWAGVILMLAVWWIGSAWVGREIAQWLVGRFR